jgi:hypothetical protein
MIATSQPKALRVLRDFVTNVDEGTNQLWTFKREQVIKDQGSVRSLLQQNVPVIEAEDEVTVVCPACDEVFGSSKAETMYAIVVRDHKTGVQYNGQFFFFRLRGRY